ncbi:hypothetical protein BVX99_03270, partial [bacterium F16]
MTEVPKVVIMEDDTLFRDLLTTHMDRLGFLTYPAIDGAEGLALIESENPDLILLDLEMPGTNGWTVLDKLGDALETLPCIIISGTGDRADVIRALQLGGWDFILKPLERLSLLTQSVQKTMERKQLQEKSTQYQSTLEDMLEVRTMDLKQSEERYRAIFEQAGVGIAELSLTGELLTANRRFVEICQRSGNQLAEMAFEELLTPNDRPVFQNAVSAIKKGESVKLKLQLLNEDPRHIWANTTLSPVAAPDGELSTLLCILEDITMAVQAQQEADLKTRQLYQADKLASLGTLVAGVAHEINNPNNFIALNIPILEDVWSHCQPVLDTHAADNPEFKLANIPYDRMKKGVPELISGIKEGSERIKVIVKHLKAYAREEAPNHSDLIDLNAVLAAALTLLANV